MTREIVIFGTSDVAELADFYFTRDSNFVVAGFTVDDSYIKQPQFRGRPLVPFERSAELFPPDHYDMFVAIGYSAINALRAAKVAAARSYGYSLVSYISSRATLFPELEVKENCFILEDNTIQPFAKIGENVTIWSGNHIGHHSTIEDNVFIASHAVISGRVRVGQGSFIGVNVTLRDRVTIGTKCIIGAGALVLQDQPDFSVVAPRGTERSVVPSTRLRDI
jgi:sugar O-acyltransferase (sialic acid O-acetyltransferase NeuD family)